MSDEKPTEAVTIAEQAAAAGKMKAEVDDIENLRRGVLKFIAGEGVSPSLTNARSKLEEMTFWLRAHRNNHAGS